MLDFARTPIGKTFLEGTMPRIAKALEKIATELVRLNDHNAKLVEQKTKCACTDTYKCAFHEG